MSNGHHSLDGLDAMALIGWLWVNFTLIRLF
jgi:hypothetical protein